MNKASDKLGFENSSTHESIKILLIDSDEATRNIISRSFRRIPENKNTFEISTTFREGLAKALTEKHDCILLNHDANDINIFEFLSEFKVHNLLEKIPVIAYTSEEDQLAIARFLKAGVSDYLLKDKINTATLKKSVDTVIKNIRLRAELINKENIIEKTNRHLHAKTKELESFYNNVSHELKTPLTSIREFSSMLKDEVAGSLNATQREYAQVCIDSCDRATIFINSVLDLIRFDTGKLSLDRSNVQIKELISEVVKASKVQAKEKEIKIKYTIKTKHKEIFIDKPKIYQVLHNFITNSIKYSENSSQITVNVRDELPKKEVLILTVKDDGQGIHPNKFEHIFDRYFQVENYEPGVNKPVELGLYLCQKIIELHGGEIYVESGVGQGSKFSVVIPLRSYKDNTTVLVSSRS